VYLKFKFGEVINEVVVERVIKLRKGLGGKKLGLSGV
jgi:hypothetical protein